MWSEDRSYYFWEDGDGTKHYFKNESGTTYKDEDGLELTLTVSGSEVTIEDKNGNKSFFDAQGRLYKMEYEYDGYHNVTKAITQTEDEDGNIVDGIVYEFTYDTYGNNTQVKIVSGDRYISSSATYTADGNRLLTTKDTLENTTTYCYNENTGVLEWVQYPNDTEENRTTYTYDDMYRMATASAAVPGLSEGTALTASYTYADDLLTEIETASTAYSFTYGDFAQRTGVSIGDRTLASYSYTDDANRYLEKLTYGNGDYIEYDYDDQGRLIQELFEDNNTVSYTYDNTGALSTVTDSATGRKTTYYYDLIDRLGKYKEVGPNYEHSVSYTYDERNNLSKLTETVNGLEHVTDYTYDYENRLIKTRYNELSGGIDMEEFVTYDEFGRLSGTKITQDYRTHISSWLSYANGKTANTTTARLTDLGFYSEAGYTIGSQYAYDNNGNITVYTTRIEYEYGNDPDIDALTRMGQSFYHYDTANQLIREDNAWLGKTFVWTYDNAGNITGRIEYPYISHTAEVSGEPTATYNYTYGDESWGDLLTAYNGIPRTYDGVGNLLTDGTWIYTWRNGRELASMTDGDTTWSYVYDANGMRTSRTNGTKTYNYVYNGSQLTQMTVGSDTLYFTYGILGPTTVTWNGTTYYYALNGQGDVTGIFDESGNLIVAYYWENAWGYNPYAEGSLASTLGSLNPLRYRSYVYDSETGYYYLQSRYYDPEIGRFINADGLVATGQGMLGNNMIAYCNNNPVIYEDASGHALKPSIEVINDGGSGVSSIDLLRLKELSELTGLSVEELGYSALSTSRIYEYGISVNISLVESILMGENDYVNSIVEVLDTIVSDTHPKIARLLTIAPYVTKSFLEYVHYTSTPKLPNGTYKVYAVDTVVSSAYIIDAFYAYRIDYHTITLVYDLKTQNGTNGGYRELDYRFYTEYTPLGG